jgi:hypothetical protein
VFSYCESGGSSRVFSIWEEKIKFVHLEMGLCRPLRLSLPSGWEKARVERAFKSILSQGDLVSIHLQTTLTICLHLLTNSPLASFLYFPLTQHKGESQLHTSTTINCHFLHCSFIHPPYIYSAHSCALLHSLMPFCPNLFLIPYFPV